MNKKVQSTGWNPPLRSRSNGVLRVVGIARISTDKQDEKSLEDQEALYRDWLDKNAGCRYRLKMISSRGSGEILDRRELRKLRRVIQGRKADLIIAEDLGRIVRRVHAILICEACLDTGTRLIALNDNVDTGRDDWRLSSMFATLRHESYNADTAKRIRRTLRNRFLQGGVLRTPLFCYRKPPGAKSDSELTKIPEMEPIIEGIIRRLEGSDAEECWSFSEVADWLNEQGVATGPASRSSKWSGKMVRRVVLNPLLKGVRVRNQKMSVRVNKTGRRKSVDAPPEELLERPVPHLAYVEADRYDRLVAKLVARGEKYSVPKVLGRDPRKDRPKKRTRFPGQQVYCSICGRPFVFGGHGQKDHLMCSGARKYQCWNAITFDSKLAADRISAAAFQAIAELPEFDLKLAKAIREEAEKLTSDRESNRNRLNRDLLQSQHELENVVQAIRASGYSPTLLNELHRIESDLASKKMELETINQSSPPLIDLPPIAEIREAALGEFKDLALKSFEFARKMRRLIPRIEVYPVRLCDGGHMGLRARFTMSLASFVPQTIRTPSALMNLERSLVVDLFQSPQRATHREAIVAMRRDGMSESAAASALGLTTTAAQRAAKLQRLMDLHGLTDPYVLVTSPPDDYRKLRRHLHARYRFEPLTPDNAA